MDLFNNREIATGIWYLVFFILFLFKKKVRESISSVLKSFLEIKIIAPILLFIVYISAIILLLYHLRIFELFLLKDTTIWVWFAGIALLFRFVTSREAPNLFWKTIKDNFNLLVVFEFIINSYTFSLKGELILVPILTVITLFVVWASTKDQYKLVSKVSQTLLGIIVIALIGVGAINAISEFNNFRSIETLKSFLLPIFLTLVSLPYLYFLVLFSNYEQLFTRLESGYEKSNELKSAAKKQIFKHCLFSVRKTQKALYNNIYNLMRIRNKNDIQEMTKTYQEKL